jgi:UDP-glucose 4-epimerase
MVVHCAGKAHVVPNTTLEKEEFYRVNLDGTENLLSTLENSLPNTLVFISSVAVYRLDEESPCKGVYKIWRLRNNSNRQIYNCIYWNLRSSKRFRIFC